MNSVWSDKIKLPSFKRLENNIKTDVLIIGGGIAGILCAHFLHGAGVDYVLTEAETICSGTTKNTTAKITSQHGLIYDRLIRQFGAKKAADYLMANQAALEKYRQLCKNVDCDFEIKSNAVYSLNDKKKIERELSALKALGFNAQYDDNPPLPFKTAGAVVFENQAQFNPLRFLASVSEKLNIFEHTQVVKISNNTAFTSGGTVSAKKIIVATHFPFINRHGSYFLKMYQHRSYVIAYSGAENIGGMYVDEAKGGMSLRNYKNLLLIGGGGHRTGMQGGSYKEIESFAKLHYPEATEKYRWAAQDCMTLDGAPYIGNYSALTPNMYAATGFNKWGMTSSMLAAQILADLVCGRKNRYADVFSPSRTILRTQTAVNFAHAVSGLVGISEKRCPHMGCKLKRNKAEHTWDCPCHGSRFDENGKLIDNPAVKDLK